jgi:hypothetical protein
VVEYIIVTSAVALVALSLGGQVAALPASNAAAVKLVVSSAKSQKIPVSGAKAAYARAPYKKPVLRYIYTAGWISGKKHWTSCRVTLISPRTAEERATEEIQGERKLRTQLRKLGVSPRTAAAALVKGVTSACS